MNQHIKNVILQIQPLRNELNKHPMYGSLKSIDDIKTFMQEHVFAVWDFMSLLKSLQNHLTCTSIPWLPNSNSKTARLINQIIVDEESDLNVDGFPMSHFEMYVESMKEIGASTKDIDSFCKTLSSNQNLELTIKEASISENVKSFINFSFDTIKANKAHEIAAAFTFGREEVIPDMFIEIIQQTEKSNNISMKKINYYLQRHIDLDGDEHGPLAHEMITDLCKDDLEKWNEVIDVSKKALEHRIKLWDHIYNLIKTSQKDLSPITA